MRVADALKLKRFVVVGHSFGGAASLMAAALFPDRVRALCLINSAGTIRHRGFTPIPRPLIRAMANGIKAQWAGGRLTEMARGAYRSRGLGGDEYTAEQLAFHARLIASIDFAEHRWAARELCCPTLVVSAEDDNMVEPKVAHTLMSALSGEAVHRHIHVPTGGHYLQKHLATTIADELFDMMRAD